MKLSTADQSARLHAAAARLLRVARRSDGLAGSGPAQTSALGALYEHGAMTVKELANSEGVAHPTMSRLLAGLEASGAVTKREDTADRRRQVVNLTGKGRRMYEAAYQRRQQLIDLLVAQLKPETVADLLAVLSAMAQRSAKRSDD